MRTIAGLMAGITALASIAVSPLPAAAAQPPRVQGYECSLLGGTGGVWQATYWAHYENIFGQRDTLMLAPCFKTKGTCEAWFYWAQTDWPDQIAKERCHKV